MTQKYSIGEAMGIGCVAVLLVFGVVTAASAFIAFLFMLAWNYVAVDVFHAPALDFWHAWGIWFLITLVGGAFRATFSSKKD